MYQEKAIQTYARIDVESAVMSASPAKLISLLFEAILSALIRARLFLQAGDIPGKCQALSKAINIITTSLSVAANGNHDNKEIDDLSMQFLYMQHRLLQANLNNDIAGIEEVETLLRKISEAWQEMSAIHHLI